MGAVAIVVIDGVVVPQGPLVIRCPQPEEALGWLLSAFYGDPGQHLALLGITGTNGKTTTATILKQLLEAGGRRAGLMGTVEVDDGKDVTPAELTTPGVVEVAEILARMRANDCQATVMEVSSHALEQGRTQGLAFDVAIFTNLSGDHLDYHGSMEAYADAKAKLFAGLAPDALAVLNQHDQASHVMLKDCRARAIGVLVGEKPPVIDLSETLHVFPEAMDVDGMSLRFVSPWGTGGCRVPLVGAHNAFNAGAALAAACGVGVDFDTALRGLSRVRSPRGRLEPVHQPADQLRVFVDYAHTDEAIVNVLRAIRDVVKTAGRLTVVFGAGGDRDRSKRPRMAKAACAAADLVMVTSDNPRTEDPEEIVREIFAGVPDMERPRVTCEVDRAVAIERVIQEARSDDIIVIAGKGHEDYQIIGTTKRHFDDVEIARQALDHRREATPA